MSVKLTGIFARCWKDQKGATAIEYGLVLVLISVAGLTAFQSLGDSISDLYGAVTTDFDAAIPGDAGAGGDAPPQDAGTALN